MTQNAVTDFVAPFVGTVGVVDWFSYGSPDTASANTGFEVSDSVVEMLYLDPTDLEIYLVLILDAANDGGGGSAVAEFEGLFGASMVFKDDPGEGSTNIDGTTGLGSASWAWVSCCTDGGILGPLEDDFCVDVTFTSAVGFTTVTTYDDVTPITLGAPGDVVTLCEGLE